MSYTITGTVPTPEYNPRRPYFDYNEAGRNRLGKVRQNGSAGRKIQVTSDNKAVARQLLSVFKAVFDDVKGTKNADS